MATTAPKHPLEPVMISMQKYILYETTSFYYLLGCDAHEKCFRVLKMDRRVQRPRSLDEVLTEDAMVYSKREVSRMLDMVHEGNKSSGGLIKVADACGLVGFVKFLDCYYFTLITQKKKVGQIGSNSIYAIKNAEVFAIRPPEGYRNELSIRSLWQRVNRKLTQTNTDMAESRYLGLFQFIDITKDFFFSYSYDLTHSLQHNYHMSTAKAFPPPPFKEMYEWNRHQTEELRGCLGDLSASHWTLPVIHGSYQQRRFNLFGQMIDIILIARRSRYYAGTRYLKRGISVHGKVANDCEMEQIVQLDNGCYSTFASYLQMRGSIPTYWYQETSVTMPKPPILVDRVDTSYLATQEHFADLIRRYGTPIVVLDLVKQHERRPRESIVGTEFRDAIEVVNASMPPDQQIRYVALDFSRMSKNKGQKKGKMQGATGEEWSSVATSIGKDAAEYKKRKSELMQAPTGETADASPPLQKPLTGRADVLRELEDIAAWTLMETSIFCSTTKHCDILTGFQPEHLKRSQERGFMEQRGVLRTNCIDCLDRTNVAQFATAVKFLTIALRALGVMDAESTLDPTNVMLLALMEMYSEMGDRIALQYGGSEAHKKGGAASKHGELLTSIKRYYSNAFTDRVKQDAMNLFLGYFQPSMHEYALWDLETDYFLHNRILSPPPPLVNAILYDAQSTRYMICDDEEKDIDVASALQNYFVSDSMTDDAVVMKISENEKRKQRLRAKQKAIHETVEMWWRVALHDFDSQLMWMRIPPPKDIIHTPYFDRVHPAYCLSFYDENLLGHEFQYPLDATTNGAEVVPAQTSGLWRRNSLRRGEASSSPTNEDAEDEISRDVGGSADDSPEQPAGPSRIDQVGFDLGRYVRDLGSKAKSMVENLLSSNESGADLAAKNVTPKRMSKPASPENWQRTSLDQSHRREADAVDENSMRLYMRYCADIAAPETYITELRENAKHDFEVLLHDVTLSADDVFGMENLSRESYIGDTIPFGQYRGMEQTDSAILAHGVMMNSVMLVEPVLESCMSCPVEAEALPVAMPEVEKQLLSKHTRQSNHVSVELPLEGRERLERILQSTDYTELCGMEEEVLSAATRYLFEQYIYSREANGERLSTRLSSLTTENIIMHYVNLFDEEYVAMDLDTIRYMAVDRATGKPYFNLEDLVQRLTPIREAYKKSKEHLLPQESPVDLSTIVQAEKTKEEESIDTLKFRQLNADLYQKTMNSHFLCNEVAAKRYSSFHSRDKYTLSKT